MDLLAVALGLAAGTSLPPLLARLREHRVHPAGLADLLLWAYLVDDGTLLLKDGGLLTGWRYRGPDLGSATPAELDLLAAHVNAALLPLGDNFMLHVSADRRPAAGYAPRGSFPHPVTALLDEERRTAHEAAGAHFETECTCVLTYLPPPDLWFRLARHFVEGDAGSFDWPSLLADFQRQAADLERRLASRLTLERLGSDALLSHLHACLTGLHQPVAVPADGASLDYVLADRDFVGGWRPRVGSRHLRVLAVHGYPVASQAGQLDFLNSLPCAARVSHRLIPLGQRSAARQIRRLRQGWFRKRKTLFDVLTSGLSPASAPSARQEEIDALFEDQNAIAMTRDAQAAEAANSSGAVRFCHYTFSIVLAEPTAEEADRAAALTLQSLADRGFTAQVETVNAVEAFLGTLPGHGHPNLRRHLLHTRNIADLLPLTSVWTGPAVVPSQYFPPGSPPLLYAATRTTPFRFTLHVSDVGHTLVIGPTGSGKSTFVNLLVAQFQRYAGAQVYVFDVGFSAYLLAQAAGARHYDISPEADSLTFQPLARLDQPGEIAWAAQWLELAATLQGQEVRSADRLALAEALRLLSHEPPEHRTLTGLTVQLQGSPHLVAALRPYTISGPLGELLDATADHLEESSYTVFEIQRLLDDRTPWISVPVLTYLFHRIEARLDGRPTLIVVEEAWLPLLHSTFADRIKAWLLTLRKKNAAVVLVTQSLAQLQATPSAALIFDSCPTTVLLPNPSATAPGNAELYAALGLNSTELRLLAEAVPKRDYYYRSPLGRRLFQLGLGPYALAWLGAAEGMTLQDTLRAADALRAAHGPRRWPSQWLRQRGLPQWAERLAAVEEGASR